MPESACDPTTFRQCGNLVAFRRRIATTPTDCVVNLRSDRWKCYCLAPRTTAHLITSQLVYFSFQSLAETKENRAKSCFETRGEGQRKAFRCSPNMECVLAASPSTFSVASWDYFEEIPPPSLPPPSHTPVLLGRVKISSRFSYFYLATLRAPPSRCSAYQSRPLKPPKSIYLVPLNSRLELGPPVH